MTGLQGNQPGPDQSGTGSQDAHVPSEFAGLASRDDLLAAVIVSRGALADVLEPDDAERVSDWVLVPRAAVERARDALQEIEELPHAA